jgi:hypothetical protein
MALATNALLTAEQLGDILGTGAGGSASLIEDVIASASSMIERFLAGRQLVTRGALTEYYSPRGDSSGLYLNQYPIISVTSVHETYARTYDATTLLVVDTDYVIETDEGALVRVAGATYGPTPWAGGYRAVKAIYVAGYKSPSGGAVGTALPADLVAIARRLCARMWKEQERRQWDVSSQSDAAGNFTRFGAATLTDAEKDALMPYMRWR